jgi:hypothetical protein
MGVTTMRISPKPIPDDITGSKPYGPPLTAKKIVAIRSGRERRRFTVCGEGTIANPSPIKPEPGEQT